MINSPGDPAAGERESARAVLPSLDDATSTILVGIAGTPPAQGALAWAAHLARATGWDLRAVHVLTWPVGIRSFDLPDSDRPWLDDQEIEASYLHGMRSVFAEVSPEPRWRLDFAQGDPGVVLASVSRSAQVLVIGSRELVAANSYLAGATSRFCTSHSTVPVTVVPISR